MVRRFTFEKLDRLSKEKDFRIVLRRSSSIRRPPLQLFYLKKETQPSKLGIWVSKRDFKTAVERNRLKRWAREFFRVKKNAFLFPCEMIVKVGWPLVLKSEGRRYLNCKLLGSRLEKMLREIGAIL